MYAACLFFKMGGNFVRLVAAARQAVDKAFILRRGSPPQWIQTRNAELWDYLLTNWPVGRTMGSSRYSWPRRGLHQYNNELQHFFKVFNGEAFAVHYDNCSVVDCAAVKKAMVRGVTQVLLRAQPVPPNEGKWTKIGPCLDFFVTGDMLSCFPALCDVAYGKIGLRQQQQDCQQVFSDEPTWHQVAGKRLERTKRTVCSDPSRFARHAAYCF